MVEISDRVMLFVGVMGTFLSSMVYSLQAPFFPREAEMKKVVPVEYGMVFGMYELTALVISPILGSYMHLLGNKFCICCGLFVAAYTCILFGTLSMMPSRTEFLAFAFLIRTLEAVGQVSNICGTTTFLATRFTESKNSVVALNYVGFSSGLVIGPALGGLLYYLGGFKLPFIIVGTILLSCTLLSIYVFPDDPVEDRLNRKVVTFKILKEKGIWLGMAVATTCSFSLGFLAATLEPHLRAFNYPPYVTSTFFLITPCTFILVNILPARAIDKYNVDPRFIIITGGFSKILAFSLIGPFPWISLNPSTGLVIAGLVLNGLGNACLITPSYGQMLRTAKECGFPEDKVTNAAVTGLFQMCMAVGLCVGPSVGGALLQYVGFRPGILTVVVMNAFLVLLCSIDTIYVWTCKRRQRYNLSLLQIDEQTALIT